MGPLVDSSAIDDFNEALGIIKSEGGEILCGGKQLDMDGFFVEPIVKANMSMNMVMRRLLHLYCIYLNLTH